MHVRCVDAQLVVALLHERVLIGHCALYEALGVVDARVRQYVCVEVVVHADVEEGVGVVVLLGERFVDHLAATEHLEA